MTTNIIRPATPTDLPRLVEIYNYYVANSHCTFDTKQFSAEQRQSWFDECSGSGPYRLLVTEADGKLVGYACSSRFKERPAYDSSVETTIYMDAEAVGVGLGQELYSTLLDELRKQGSIHRAYGVISLPNQQSVALHERFGFKHVGTCHEVGFKFGKYWDVGWFEKDMSRGITNGGSGK